MAKESKIVAAVGISANSSMGGPARIERVERIQAAMDKAVLDACADGLRVSEDAEQIRERVLAARQRILDEG